VGPQKLRWRRVPRSPNPSLRVSTARWVKNSIDSLSRESQSLLAAFTISLSVPKSNTSKSGQKIRALDSSVSMKAQHTCTDQGWGACTQVSGTGYLIFLAPAPEQFRSKQKKYCIICITRLDRNANFTLWLHHLKYFCLRPSKNAWAPQPRNGHAHVCDGNKIF